MSEKELETNQIFSRPARLSDFFDGDYDTSSNKNKYYSHKNESIEKNQQEFGQRKRIKP
jgi:hypothetical protein